MLRSRQNSIHFKRVLLCFIVLIEGKFSPQSKVFKLRSETPLLHSLKHLELISNRGFLSLGKNSGLILKLFSKLTTWGGGQTLMMKINKYPMNHCLICSGTRNGASFPLTVESARNRNVIFYIHFKDFRFTQSFFSQRKLSWSLKVEVFITSLIIAQSMEFWVVGVLLWHVKYL